MYYGHSHNINHRTGSQNKPCYK